MGVFNDDSGRLFQPVIKHITNGIFGLFSREALVLIPYTIYAKIWAFSFVLSTD